MFTMLQTWINARMDVASEEGQTLVEYALILALIAVVIVGALTTLGGGINGAFGGITDALNLD